MKRKEFGEEFSKITLCGAVIVIVALILLPRPNYASNDRMIISRMEYKKMMLNKNKAEEEENKENAINDNISSKEVIVVDDKKVKKPSTAELIRLYESKGGKIRNLLIRLNDGRILIDDINDVVYYLDKKGEIATTSSKNFNKKKLHYKVYVIERIVQRDGVISLDIYSNKGKSFYTTPLVQEGVEE